MELERIFSSSVTVDKLITLFLYGIGALLAEKELRKHILKLHYSYMELEQVCYYSK